MNAAPGSPQSQPIFFLISLSNYFHNKAVRSDARAVFQTPTLCQHLFTAAGRADALLLRQALGKASGQPRLPRVTTELTTSGSSKTRPD